MCDSKAEGGRRCDAEWDQAHADRYNARRRVVRNTNKAERARREGHDQAAARYEQLAAQAAQVDADLTARIAAHEAASGTRPDPARCPGCGQYTSGGHSCPVRRHQMLAETYDPGSRTAREEFITRFRQDGPVNADLVDFVERWTPSKAAVAELREEAARGEWPNVVSAINDARMEHPRLYRGMHGLNEDSEALITSLRRGSVIDTRGMASFSPDKDRGTEFGGTGTSVLMRLPAGDRGALRITSLSTMPTQEEWLVGGQLRVTRVFEDRAGQTWDGKTYRHLVVDVERVPDGTPDAPEGGSTQCPDCGQYAGTNHTCPDRKQAVMEAHAAGWSSTFDEEEATAWDTYGSVHHEDLNRRLREGEPLTDTDERIITALDSALARAPRTDEPVTVYRGISTLRVSGGEEVGLSAREWISRNARVGEQVTFPGYTSTSLSPDLAARFAGSRQEYSLDGVAFEIETTQGAYRSGGAEQEVILARGTTFEVVGVDEDAMLDGRNIPVVRMREVAPAGTSSPSSGPTQTSSTGSGDAGSGGATTPDRCPQCGQFTSQGHACPDGAPRLAEERDRFMTVNAAYFGGSNTGMDVAPPADVHEVITEYAQTDLARDWVTADGPTVGNCDVVAADFAATLRERGIDAQPVLGMNDPGSLTEQERLDGDTSYHVVTCIHHDGQHLHVDWTAKQFAVTQADVGPDQSLEDDPLAAQNLPTPMVWDADQTRGGTVIGTVDEWRDRGPGEPSTMTGHFTATNQCPDCGRFAGADHACRTPEPAPGALTSDDGTSPTTPATAQGPDEQGEKSFEYRMEHKAPYNDADEDDPYYNHIGNLTSSFPDDVYDHPDWYGTADDETMAQLRAVRDDPDATVTIYRAVPAEHDEINKRDWVTLSRAYAEGHAHDLEADHRDGIVVSATVPASQVWTDGNDLAEFGYDGPTHLTGLNQSDQPTRTASPAPAGSSHLAGAGNAGTAATAAARSHPLANGPDDPVAFTYVRNPVSSTTNATNQDFAQDLEPSGRYMSEAPPGGHVPDGWETGTVEFTRPLRIHWGEGGYGDDDNWKRRLSDHYDGKTGTDLSDAIRADGYDAIITSDKYGTSEVVDLTGQAPPRPPGRTHEDT